jgi:pimeloyl-ACP methyl ester carboxylesterase
MDPDTRTPVYFVHGYNSAGAEHDLHAYMQSLDPARYRVVPFDYDYTQRLGKSARQLAEKIKAEGRPVHVLAHSMGGLVGLGAVKELTGTGAVRSLTTVATPFNGHKGAALGHYLQPFARREVLKDMIPGSNYQRSLSDPHPGTKHNVFLVDKDGTGNDDETISLDSQSKRKVLSNASEVAGFRDTHTGILKNQAAISLWAQRVQEDDAAPIVAGVGPQ